MHTLPDDRDANGSHELDEPILPSSRVSRLGTRPRWGDFDSRVRSDGFGTWTDLSLVLNAPGTSAWESHASALARATPVVAGLFCVVVLSLLATTTSTAGMIGVIALALPLLAVAIVLPLRRTRRVRRATVRLRATVIRHGASERVFGPRTQIIETARAMYTLDEAVRAGELTIAQHESEWGALYTSILTGTPLSRRSRLLSSRVPAQLARGALHSASHLLRSCCASGCPAPIR